MLTTSPVTHLHSSCTRTSSTPSRWLRMKICAPASLGSRPYSWTSSSLTTTTPTRTKSFGSSCVSTTNGLTSPSTCNRLLSKPTLSTPSLGPWSRSASSLRTHHATHLVAMVALHSKLPVAPTAPSLQGVTTTTTPPLLQVVSLLHSNSN